MRTALPPARSLPAASTLPAPCAPPSHRRAPSDRRNCPLRRRLEATSPPTTNARPRCRCPYSTPAEVERELRPHARRAPSRLSWHRRARRCDYEDFQLLESLLIAEEAGSGRRGNEEEGVHCKKAEDQGKVIMKNPYLNVEEAKRRSDVAMWLNSLFSDLKLPLEPSEEELRTCLVDGSVLCGILNKLNSVPVGERQHGNVCYPGQHLENVKKFLSAVSEKGLLSFRESDLKQGPISTVVDCLLSLRAYMESVEDITNNSNSPSKCGCWSRKRWKLLEVEKLENTDMSRGDHAQGAQNSPVSGERIHTTFSDSKIQRILKGHVMPESSTALQHHIGNKFHEVYQLKQGRYSDLPADKISEMMKSNSLDNAPTQSLLSVVNGILDESVERKNGEIPHRVACLLRKVVQEIERRISTQAEHIRNQNSLIKAREEKYQSRIRVLETLATGTSEEAQIVTNQLQIIKTEKTKVDDRKRNGDQDVLRLTREKENSDIMIAELKQQMERKDKSYEQHCMQLELKAKETKMELEEKIKENSDLMIAELKQQMERKDKSYEQHCMQLELKAKETKMELEEKIKDTEFLLEKSRKRTKELEALTVSKAQSWNEMELVYQNFVNFQLQELKGLRVSADYIKHEVLNVQRTWHEEFLSFGTKLEGLAEAAQNYHTVLEENRKLYNEVQELKGNIRVFCRIRPFLPGQSKRVSTIDYIGENGELLLVNPSKQGKDGHRMFKFNRTFGPAASQEEVFLDTQPLVRSVLDGYNVCICAYGQTGSGKTYTMSGPNGASKEEWGVNYRALNDLFDISRNRRNTIMYEIGVQMVEIYNEQVRDLLSNNANQKKLGILNSSHPTGLAVPDATMLVVKSTTDVLDLMQIGLKNRAVSATALNERSSRSHSVLSVHVRGMDLETGASLRGSLHLVDLAGSERVDRSEVTGDRLKEAQHINKSLSALGDVIFALAQKSSHVPYRNSKLTQVLQSSLGGQAKTLMFVQINPDAESYSETFSTLKFAERVSGVELGAARSNKEGKDVKELMEQVASLKDMITRKDEEIEQLQLLKDPKTLSPSAKIEKHATFSLRHSSSPGGLTNDGISPRDRRSLNGKPMGHLDKGTPDADILSSESDKHSEAGSLQSVDELKQNETSSKQRQRGGDTGQTFAAESELLEFGDAASEGRLSDISDSGLSMGTETDGSMSSVVGFTPFPESSKPNDGTEKVSKVLPRDSRAPPQKSGSVSPSHSRLKETPKSASPRKVASIQATASTKLSKRWQ